MIFLNSSSLDVRLVLVRDDFVVCFNFIDGPSSFQSILKRWIRFQILSTFS